MNVLKNRALTLVTALVIAGAGCKGDKGDPGTSGTNGTNASNPSALTTDLLQITVTSVKVNADQSVAVNFTMKDGRGAPVDVNGVYSINTPFLPRFSLSQIQLAADGSMLPYNVFTKTGSSVTLPQTDPAPNPAAVALSPTSVTPVIATPTAPTATPNPVLSGVLVDNGGSAGDYSYTFPFSPDGAAVGMTRTDGTGASAGKYVYAFANSVRVDPASTSTYTIWIEAKRQTNLNNVNDPRTFQGVDAEYNFVPGSATATPLKRELVKVDACNACHRGFKPETSVASGGFHGYSRIAGTYCNVCHNVARVSTSLGSDLKTPQADSSIFVHRIHASKEMLVRQTANTSTSGYQWENACTLQNPCVCSDTHPCYPSGAKTGVISEEWQGITCGDGLAKNPKPCACTVAKPCLPNVFHAISDVSYPQDLRNCETCHGGAAQGDQVRKKATRAVCGSCHDKVVFDAATATKLSLPFCVDQGTGVDAGNVPCLHSMGAKADDADCAGCHIAGVNASAFIGEKHLAVIPPDPNNSLAQVVGTATTGTAAGVACTVAAPCTCTVAVPCIGSGNNNTNAAWESAAGVLPPGVSTFKWLIKSVSRDSSKHPVMVFKVQKDGVDAPFNTCGQNSATYQLFDGFIGSPSLYFVWAMPQDGIARPADFNVSASAYLKTVCNTNLTTATTIAGPDATGYYTVTFVNQTVADVGTMLTGGVGYTYALTATQPLTQVNLPAYPYNTTLKTGGIVVAPQNQTMTATGYTGRRAIVDTALCNKCHGQLGVAPTFHAGQRNDGPTCSWCHNPNRTSSGWSANGKDFIHAVHAGSHRETAFNWHAAAPGENYGEVTFPGPLNDCQACHLPNTYDFSASASAAAVPNLLLSYVATGKFDGADATKNYAFSPYIVADNSSYGAGFSVSGNKTLVVTSGTAITGTGTFTTGTATSGSQGATACTVAAPCTCTAGSPCTVVACTAVAPCTCTTSAQCVGVVQTTPVTSGNSTTGTGTFTTGTATSGVQGGTACTVAAPCTCTVGSPCTVVACTVAAPCACTTLAPCALNISCSLNAPCDADPMTLVVSPVTAACVACHDSEADKAHMTLNGGSFYVQRSVAATAVEQCLLCHGPSSIAPIADVHR